MSLSLLLASLAVGGLLGLTDVRAGATSPVCTGSEVLDVSGPGGVVLYDVTGFDVRTVGLGFTLPAGSYEVMTSSFDGYPGRRDEPEAGREKAERWYAEFLDAAGRTVGALSGVTSDLPDDTDSAVVVDRFAPVELSAEATAVRFVLASDLRTLNLVHVGCLGFERLPDATTTTAPSVGPGGPGENGTTPLDRPALVTMARPAELPMTGVEVTPLLLAGLGAAVAGFVLLVRSRTL